MSFPSSLTVKGSFGLFPSIIVKMIADNPR